MKVLLLLVVLSFSNEVSNFQWLFDSEEDCEAAKAQIPNAPYFQNKATRPQAYAAACAPLNPVVIKL